MEEVLPKVNMPIHLLNWQDEIESSPHYHAKRHAIYSLYETNKNFRHDIHEEVKRVIESYPYRQPSDITEDMLIEGAHYILKEMVFLLACPDILHTDDIAIVYYREWQLWENFSNGYYNQEILKIGFLKIS